MRTKTHEEKKTWNERRSYPKRMTHDVVLQPFPDFVFEKYRLCRGFLSVIEAHLCPLTNRLYDLFTCPASMGLQNTRQQLEPKCSLDKSEYTVPTSKKRDNFQNTIYEDEDSRNVLLFSLLGVHFVWISPKTNRSNNSKITKHKWKVTSQYSNGQN